MNKVGTFSYNEMSLQKYSFELNDSNTTLTNDDEAIWLD